MSGAPRQDLFTHIHKALRHGLFAVTEQLGATDWHDASAARRAVDAWDELDVQLRSHGRHEDEHIFALLEAKRPGATAALAEQHHRLDPLQSTTAEAVHRAGRTGDSDDGLAAYRASSRFCGVYLGHLLDEEQHVMPAIWDTCTDEEIEDCRRTMLATVPPAESAVTQAWLLVSVDPATRKTLVVGARRVLPPPAFEGLVALAASVLAPADFEDLAAALEAG